MICYSAYCSQAANNKVTKFLSFLSFDRRKKKILWGLDLAISSKGKGPFLQISHYPSCKSPLQNFPLYNEGTVHDNLLWTNCQVVFLHFLALYLKCFVVLISDKLAAILQLDPVRVQYLRDGVVVLIQGEAQLWLGEVVQVGIIWSLKIF